MTEPNSSRRGRCAASLRAFRIWNALTWWLWPLVGLYTLSRLRGKKAKSWAWLHGAWGRVGPEATADVWIHAVSVGETQAAKPIARALREMMPGCRIVISSTTETGHHIAKTLVAEHLCNAAIYFPVDVPIAVRRVLRRVRPRVVVLMETELWPNFLHLAQAQGAKVVLANGRVSDNLNSTARRFAPLFRWMLGNVDALLMRSEFDAQRMRVLTAPTGFSSHVQVVGDVKLDRPAGAQRDEAARQHWRTTLGIMANAPFWIAGSTHPGEEALILDAFAEIRAQFPSLRLLIAPRHIDRIDEVESLVTQREFRGVRRSQSPPEINDAILLLDTVGELAAMYAACEVAFVGGSLIPRGGHNLLEPVLAGAPVIFGPHVQNFRETAQLALQANLGSEVSDAPTLAAAIVTWLHDTKGRAAILERADQALQTHRGAVRRVAECITGFLGRES